MKATISLCNKKTMNVKLVFYHSFFYGELDSFEYRIPSHLALSFVNIGTIIEIFH